MLPGVRISVTCGRGSSSVMVTAAPDTVSPEAAPVSVRVSAPSYRASSVGDSENVPWPLCCPAAMVTVKSSTAA